MKQYKVLARQLQRNTCQNAAMRRFSSACRVERITLPLEVQVAYHRRGGGSDLAEDDLAERRNLRARKNSTRGGPSLMEGLDSSIHESTASGDPRQARWPQVETGMGHAGCKWLSEEADEAFGHSIRFRKVASRETIHTGGTLLTRPSAVLAME